VVFHVGVGSPASVDQNTFPAPLPTTHRLLVGHEMARAGKEEFPIVVVTQELALVGSVDATTLPLESPATQRSPPADVHEIAPSDVPPTCATCQAPAPPVGLVEVTAFPAPSTATQSVGPAQDTAWMKLLPSTLTIAQTGLASPGFVDVTTLPVSSTATQKYAVGPVLKQEIPSKEAGDPVGGCGGSI
jgi:hypothetical protein